MGGSLIVIASSDHQSNNTSDQYQQTFYVAEHALIEAEKHLINRILGPWVTATTLESCGTAGEACNMSNYKKKHQMIYQMKKQQLLKLSMKVI